MLPIMFSSVIFNCYHHRETHREVNEMSKIISHDGNLLLFNQKYQKLKIFPFCRFYSSSSLVSISINL